MRCTPPEQRRRAAHCRDQLWRIAGPAGPLDRRHPASSHAARRLHDLADGAARTSAQIHCDRGATIERHVQRAQMRVGDIGDVDIIPNRRPVGRRIIGAVHVERLTLAERRGEHVRDQMRLRIVVFSPLLRGTRGIEVAQAHHPHAVLRCDFGQ